MEGLAPATQIILDHTPIRVVGSEGQVGIPWPIVTDTFVMSSAKAKELACQLWRAADVAEASLDAPSLVDVCHDQV